MEREVAPAEDGKRADVVVAGWLGEPRGRVQARFEAGVVLLEGEPAAKSRRLRAGQVLSVGEPPAEPQPPAAGPVPVRYRDTDLLVVAKPAGMVVHTGAGTRPGATLVDALRAMNVPLASGGDPQRPGIVHRLDRGTSGLLVVASTEAARAALTAMFKVHDVERRYFAIVDGVPDPPSATIDAPLGRSTTNRTTFTVDARGRRAVSSYDVVESFGRASLVAVSLETGRTHQVRVHLSAVGHPVSGDTAYGASRPLRDQLRLTRPALHAGHLAFDHPVTGQRIAVDEPLPDDLEAALAVLRAQG